ncbi:MAG: SAM-dependent chlorinase/fluorinase [Planctomycetes bacterium]|nr:SAM-dependent chlorinase/fluorinase [Planctomycetota bacterium]
MSEDRGRPLCVLLTDFPLADPYAGVMKGVVLGGAPDAVLVDLAHGLPAGDIAWAALQLREQAGYFPAGAVFLAVVDPGVGTARRILAAEAGLYRFVGPDNGLLHPALVALSGAAGPQIVAVDAEAVGLAPRSETFHGRDVMAPAAARLLAGAALETLGRPVDDPVALALPAARRAGAGWVGAVLAADGYGNLITSIESALLEGGEWHVYLEGRDLGPVCRTFGSVASGAVVALVGSLRRIEIAVRDGSARDRLRAAPGMQVEVRPRS